MPESQRCQESTICTEGKNPREHPPTADALLQHTKRVAYQAGHCWRQCLVSVPELPSPGEWGWTRSESDTWQPRWTTLPEASKICQELVKCGCRAEKGCKGRCKCVKAGMPCMLFANVVVIAKKSIEMLQKGQCLLMINR